MDIISSFTLFMSNLPQNKPLSQCYSIYTQKKNSYIMMFEVSFHPVSQTEKRSYNAY